MRTSGFQLSNEEESRRYLYSQIDAYIKAGLEAGEPFMIYVVDQRTGGSSFIQFNPGAIHSGAPQQPQSPPQIPETPITNNDIVELFMALGGTNEKK